MWKRLRAIANHPVTPLVLAVLLVMDLWCLTSRLTQYPTTMQQVLYHLRGLAVKWNLGHFSAIIFEHDDGTLELVYDDDWQDHHFANNFQHVVENVLVSRRRITRGLYAPAWLTHSYAVHVVSHRASTPPEAVALRAELIRQTVASGYFPRTLSAQDIAALLHTGSVRHTSWLPLGSLHNTLALGMLLMLLWSLRLNVPKLWQRRDDPTACRRCGYSTAGVTRGVCPECGEEIGASTGMEPRP